MKKLIALAILTLTFSTGISFAGAKPRKEEVVVLSTKREMFYFKVKKSFLGATIEVYDSSNKKTGSELVFAKRMLLDFYYMPADTYVIKIKKGDQLLEFQYTKE